MAAPKKNYTLEAIKERCTEEGECWIWQGYIRGGIPYACHMGKMTPLRKHICSMLKNTAGKMYFVASCGNPSCVNPEHILALTERQHLTRAAGKSNTVGKQLALAESAKRRNKTKITDEQVAQIYFDPRSSRLIALDYNVDKSFVCGVKRHTKRAAVTRKLNPFLGLMQ